MYIYLIKYNGEVIAAAEDELTAKDAIENYLENNRTAKTTLFEKETIRYFPSNFIRRITNE